MDTDKIKVCLHFLKLVASCYKLGLGIHCTIEVRIYIIYAHAHIFLVCSYICYGTLKSNESDAIFLLSSQIFGSRVRVDSTAKVAEIEQAEKEKMKEKVERILKHGINCFINRSVHSCANNICNYLRKGFFFSKKAYGNTLHGIRDLFRNCFFPPDRNTIVHKAFALQ